MKVAIIVLGCDKNTVDTEHLAGLLMEKGHEVAVEGEQQAVDVLVIMTCGFIQSAREENLAVIQQAVESKIQHGNPRRIVIAGCLAQRSAVQLAQQFPEIDAFAGVGRPAYLLERIEQIDSEIKREAGSIPTPDMRQHTPQFRTRLDPLPHAYLKIADGCNHTCTFCAIPAIKGRYASVPKEHLLEEATGLAQIGAKEIILIAQDLAPYGADLYEDYRLTDLLNDLCAIEEDFRIRLLYMYPGGINDTFLEVFANQPKICKYLDLPLQHLDPAVLSDMKRPAAEASTHKLIERIRKAVPEVALRTTMIVGYPTETKKAFQNLIAGIEEIQFDWLGAFPFSPEEGTPAGETNNPIPRKMVERRLDKLLKTQQAITHQKQQTLLGSTLPVLIEGLSEDGLAGLGRSFREAPEVDGAIHIELDQLETPPQIGDIIPVRIFEADVYDLFGESICQED